MKRKIIKKFSNIYDAIENKIKNEHLILYILSFINLIVEFIMTIKEVGAVKQTNLDEYFKVFPTTFINNIFNIVFITLFVGIIILYILINIIKYFKSKEKSIIAYILLIATLVFFILDGLFLVADKLSSDSILYRILDALFSIFGRDNYVLSTIVYFSIPIICVLLFLRLFSEKKIISNVICVLVNTVGVMMLSMILTLLYALPNIIFYIIISIILLLAIVFYYNSKDIINS